MSSIPSRPRPHRHRWARRCVQFGFLALTLVGVFVFQANCERWCPFGGVESIHGYVTEGNMVCSLAVSNFYILGGVLLMTLLLRRAFCGYMCPIGTISEWLRSIAKRLRIPEVRVPPAVDRVLSPLKYVVLAVILYTTWKAAELLFRAYDPCYALISRHGADITVWAYVVAGAIVLGSLIFSLPFCRWLCPFAAVLHPLSRIGLTQVTRDEDSCKNCGKCNKVCPVAIPVDQVTRVNHASCLSCFNCVDACSNLGVSAMQWGPSQPFKRWLGQHWSQAALIAILLTCTTAAVATSYLLPLPSFVKVRGTVPDTTATVDLEIENLDCRGRANLLFWFLDRDDLYALPGYVRLEAWPQPRTARVKVFYDPSQTSEVMVRRAITEPYYNLAEDQWRRSPFRVVGYDPLAIDETDDLPDDSGPPALPLVDPDFDTLDWGDGLLSPDEEFAPPP
jgi:ferredoxin